MASYGMAGWASDPWLGPGMVPRRYSRPLGSAWYGARPVWGQLRAQYDPQQLRAAVAAAALARPGVSCGTAVRV